MRVVMNKKGIIEYVADKTLTTKLHSTEMVNAVLEGIIKTLKSGEDVIFVEFGKFYVHSRKERSGRNPKTGDPLLIPASKTIKFKPGKPLRHI